MIPDYDLECVNTQTEISLHSIINGFALPLKEEATVQIVLLPWFGLVYGLTPLNPAGILRPRSDLSARIRHWSGFQDSVCSIEKCSWVSDSFPLYKPRSLLPCWRLFSLWLWCF